MPLDIELQVSTALDNIFRELDQHTPSKPTTPLETRINDLKETAPNKYREYISTLTSSANSGNERARELLGKVGEDAARQRRGYEELNKAILESLPILGAGKAASWLYNQLPNKIKLGIDIGYTVDGARNIFGRHSLKKTYMEAKAGNYRGAISSGIENILDIYLPKSITGLLRNVRNWGKTRKINLGLDLIKGTRRVVEPAIGTAMFSRVGRADLKPYLSGVINKNFPTHVSGNIVSKDRLYKPADEELRFVIPSFDNKLNNVPIGTKKRWDLRKD